MNSRNTSQRISHILYLLYSKRSVKTPPDDEINFTGFTTSGSGRSKLNIVYGISQTGCAETRCYYTPRLARHPVDVYDR